MKNKTIGVIGLGYVGLPLAVEFGKQYKTIGFDIDCERISELNHGIDATLEVEDEELQKVLIKESSRAKKGLVATSNLKMLKGLDFYIITVPTPTDKNNRPIITPLQKASETVGKAMEKGCYVVYESTVYPGLTEDECVPILERNSGLKFNKDFYVGYSPERINPGDKEHTVTKILKVTSGSTPRAATTIDKLYKSVIKAGTFKAASIKVAEAAKVIENCQRDINIAFVNELARIFNHMDIDTNDVLEAAGTKWNFLQFKPGLVGGHCIGVDPYYLAQKSQEVGYHPEIILAGRRMNDTMGQFVASEMVKLMINKGIPVKGCSALMLGITFKENCPDIRNTRAIDIYRELLDYGLNVDVYDPWADAEEVKEEYQLRLKKSIKNKKYDGIILCVPHQKFKRIRLNNLRKRKSVIYDVKNFLPRKLVDGRL